MLINYVIGETFQLGVCYLIRKDNREGRDKVTLKVMDFNFGSIIKFGFYCEQP